MPLNLDARTTTEWRPYLALADEIRLALDGDAAGQAGAAAWRQAYPGATAQPLPAGVKDVTELWAAGADVRAWAMG